MQVELVLESDVSGTESQPLRHGWVALSPKVPPQLLPGVTCLGVVDAETPNLSSAGHYLGPACASFHAIVIGNDAYTMEAPLHSCVGDAQAVAELFAASGYSVLRVLDGDLQTTQAALALFVHRLRPGHTAVLYFSGHGVQCEGINYLLPTNGNSSDPGK